MSKDDHFNPICPRCRTKHATGGRSALKEELAEKTCSNCEFPMFMYHLLMREHASVLEKNENERHLLEYDNCVEFLKWATEREMGKWGGNKRNPHGFTMVG